MTRLFSLRFTLPAGMAVVLIVLLGLFNLDAYLNEHDQMMRTARSESLARWPGREEVVMKKCFLRLREAPA